MISWNDQEYKRCLSRPSFRLPEIFKMYARFLCLFFTSLIPNQPLGNEWKFDRHYDSRISWNKHGFQFSSRAKSFTIYIDLKLRSADAHFRFIGNPSRCINVRYAIPFIVIPFMFWVRVMLEFRIAKEKEKQKDTVKRPQLNVFFFWDQSLSEKTWYWIFQSSLFKNSYANNLI